MYNDSHVKPNTLMTPLRYSGITSPAGKKDHIEITYYHLSIADPDSRLGPRSVAELTWPSSFGVCGPLHALPVLLQRKNLALKAMKYG